MTFAPSFCCIKKLGPVKFQCKALEFRVQTGDSDVSNECTPTLRDDSEC
jgi:hypothetical protein